MPAVDLQLRPGYTVILVKDDQERSSALAAGRVLGERVRELRTARGWSQEHLAEQMRAAGFGTWRQTTVAKTEAARRPVTAEEVVKLAELFDVNDLNVLLLRRDEHPLDPRLRRYENAALRYRVGAEQAEAEAGTLRQALALAERRARTLFLVTCVDNPHVDTDDTQLVDVVARVIEEFARGDEWKDVLVEAGWWDRTTLDAADAATPADELVKEERGLVDDVEADPDGVSAAVDAGRLERRDREKALTDWSRRLAACLTGSTPTPEEGATDGSAHDPADQGR